MLQVKNKLQNQGQIFWQDLPPLPPWLRGIEKDFQNSGGNKPFKVKSNALDSNYDHRINLK